MNKEYTIQETYDAVNLLVEEAVNAQRNSSYFIATFAGIFAVFVGFGIDFVSAMFNFPPIVSLMFAVAAAFVVQKLSYNLVVEHQRKVLLEYKLIEKEQDDRLSRN